MNKFKPKKTKYKKYHKCWVNRTLKNFKNRQLVYGSYGLKALEWGRLTPKHLEALRRAIRRATKRTGRLWIRVFPHIPISSKPNENRMGKGKGKIKYYAANVAVGDVIVELSGISFKLANIALAIARKKLPLKNCYFDKFHRCALIEERRACKL